MTNPDAMRAFEANQGALTSALSRLMVIAEQYPELKATEGFQHLAELGSKGLRTGSPWREGLHDTVRIYNTELNTFPGVIWKSILYADRSQSQQ